MAEYEDLSILIATNDRSSIAPYIRSMQKSVGKTFISQISNELISRIHDYGPDILFCDTASTKIRPLKLINTFRKADEGMHCVICVAADDYDSLADLEGVGNVFTLLYPLEAKRFKEVMQDSLLRKRKEIHTKQAFLNTSLETLPGLAVRIERDVLIDYNREVERFFGIENRALFLQQYEYFSHLFVPHQEALTLSDSRGWPTQLMQYPEPERLVAMKSVKDEVHFFKVECQHSEEGVALVSFIDITSMRALWKLTAQSKQDEHPWMSLKGAVKREIKRSKRHKLPLSFAMLSLVDKQTRKERINQHDKKLFLVLEKALHGMIRPMDTFGMWDKNRYLLILPHTESKSVGCLIERLFRVFKGTYVLNDYNLYYKVAVLEYEQGELIDGVFKKLENGIQSGLQSQGNHIQFA